MLPIIHTRSIPQHISDPLQYKSGRTPTGSHYDSPPSFVRSFRQLLPFPPNSLSKPSPPICCRWNSAATTRASTTSVDRLVTGDPPETQTNKKSQDTNLHHATNTVQIRAQRPSVSSLHIPIPPMRGARIGRGGDAGSPPK